MAWRGKWWWVDAGCAVLSGDERGNRVKGGASAISSGVGWVGEWNRVVVCRYQMDSQILPVSASE
jgi:hypothetical protein